MQFFQKNVQKKREEAAAIELAPAPDGKEAAQRGTLTYFYLPYCPHCKLATRCIDELMREDARYNGIKINMVDESREREYANSFDYYLVPSFFLGDRKLFEGHMEKRDVRRALDEALGTGK